ncbi:MAG: hypothetical protein M1821_004142 [Bathelium mastoideum]|nr:MAG: hypothetical protein M1821_004142 [Bathelium mastoideum]
MLQRPRNRQSRSHNNHQPANPSSRQPSTNHPSSHRGRARGPRPPRDNRPSLTAVPTTRDVRPGARVLIVLKADQGTGREVRGVVSEVLTRGEHPRGIKVRLDDGRVGRVQRMVVGDEVAGGEASEMWEDGRDDEEDIEGGRDGEWGRREVNLGALLVDSGADGGGGEGRGRAWEGRSQEDEHVSVCPVCGTFKGDEAAVAHHVNSHFE